MSTLEVHTVTCFYILGTLCFIPLDWFFLSRPCFHRQSCCVTSCFSLESKNNSSATWLQFVPLFPKVRVLKDQWECRDRQPQASPASHSVPRAAASHDAIEASSTPPGPEAGVRARRKLAQEILDKLANKRWTRTHAKEFSTLCQKGMKLNLFLFCTLLIVPRLWRDLIGSYALICLVFYLYIQFGLIHCCETQY